MGKGFRAALAALWLLCSLAPAAAADTAAGDLSWLERLAAQGDAEAWYRIGLIKEQGIGMAPEPAGALVAYGEAAALGHGPAQLRLAQLLAGGYGGAAPDFVGARGWYEAAAAQGIAEAAYNAGLFAQLGLGGPEDLPAAIAFFQAAVAGGLGDAAVQLALLHLDGSLLQPDRVVALAWALKGRTLGAVDADALVAALRQQLTADEVATATALAATL